MISSYDEIIKIFYRGIQMKRIDVNSIQGGQLLFLCQFSKELLSVSGTKNIQFDHVALALDKYRVIEASPFKGVTITPLLEFIKKGPVFLATVADQNIAANATHIAMDFLNSPYNFTYEHSVKNGLYCSQLITHSFEVANQGKPYFKEDTLNFKDASGKIPTYWVEYYKEYNRTVPHGMKGSHPSRLFLDKKIIEKRPLYLDKGLYRKTLSPQPSPTKSMPRWI